MGIDRRSLRWAADLTEKWHRVGHRTLALAPPSGCRQIRQQSCRNCRHVKLSEIRMERVTGIEPAPSAWKAEALPLSYTRNAVSV